MVYSGSYAVGGTGGTGSTQGLGGAATATTSGTGVTVTSSANAYGGSGRGLAGTAIATSTANGKAGSYAATAQSQAGSGGLIQNLAASASGTLDGTATSKSAGTAFAETTIGTAAPVFSTTRQALAQVTGAPLASDVNPILSSNTNINASFNAASNLMLAEVGGRHDTTGTHAETITDTIDLTIDPTKLSSPHELLLGLYSGTEIGSGFTSLAFSVTVAGTTVVNQTFSSNADALTYFHDHVFDLGIVSSSPFTVHTSLTETTTALNSGFAAGLLLGATHA